MGKITNIIFDFDGTLVNTTPLILATMKATVAEMKLPERTDAEYKATIGLRLEEIPSVLWPGNIDALENYATTYRRIFDMLKRPLGVESYSGVEMMLKTLHECGYRMAIASSRSHHSIREYVEQIGISDYFSMLVGGDDIVKGKPAPDPVIRILDGCSWKVMETITVGDAPVDIMMGKAAGTATCAVTYGNGKRCELNSAMPTYIVDSFDTLFPIVKGVAPEIIDYVETEIIPQYDRFDKAHGRSHVRMVISQSLSLSEKLPELDIDMIYCIAAFHDLGLCNGRENHHVDSGKILETDAFIRRYFREDDIETMKEAVEDHRASGKTVPRSIYGKIVADADRFIDAETIVRRTIQYGLSNYPALDKEGHYQRMLSHLKEKYGPAGYLRVWLPWSGNADRLKRLYALIADEDALTCLFNRIFEEETAE